MIRKSLEDLEDHFISRLTLEITLGQKFFLVFFMNLLRRTVFKYQILKTILPNDTSQTR